MTTEETTRSALIERAVSRLRTAWRDLTASGRAAKPAPTDPDLPEEDQAGLIERIDACLEGKGGEVSARARAADLGRHYLGLSPTGRHRFFQLLAERFGTDDREIRQAIDVLDGAHEQRSVLKAQRKLKAALTPPCIRLLSQFTSLPDGIKFLVDLRTELREVMGEAPQLNALDDQLRELLAGWFDIGFLRLERITWRAPAALLEKLAAHEAVHRVHSWQDLKNRLDSDRR